MRGVEKRQVDFLFLSPCAGDRRSPRSLEGGREQKRRRGGPEGEKRGWKEKGRMRGGGGWERENAAKCTSKAYLASGAPASQSCEPPLLEVILPPFPQVPMCRQDPLSLGLEVQVPRVELSS